MAFLETPRFPETISFGAIGGPGFNTDVVTVTAGTEKRNALWSRMKHAYEVSQAVKDEADFKDVRAFFLAVGGKRDGFRFKDFADYTVSLSEGVAVAIDSTTSQLQKKYVSGSTTTLRDIQKPLAGLVLKNSGTLMTLGTDYTLDTATGIVTALGTPPDPTNLTWSGEFDVPCRFDTDKLQAKVIDRSIQDGLLLAWDSIPLIEIRI